MANEYEKIPVPGYNTGNQSTDPELMASMDGYLQKGVTVASGQGILPIGTVLGRKTSDKKYYVYDNAGSGGVEVARGILRRAVDTSSGDQLANIVYRGVVKLSLVSGADSAAITDLNARTDSVANLFIF